MGRSLLQIIDDYDRNQQLRILELEEENQKLRDELGEVTSQMVRFAGEQSSLLLKATLAGCIISSPDADLRDQAKKMIEATS